MTIVFDTAAGTVRARAAGTLAARRSRHGDQRPVVRRAGQPDGQGRRPPGARRRGVRRRVLRDRRQRGGRVVGRCVARVPELRRAGREIAAAVDAVQAWATSGHRRRGRYRRHDLHGAAAVRGRRPSIRDRSRRWPGRPVAGRNGDRGTDGRARRDGPARRRSAVCPRGDRRHAPLRPRLAGRTSVGELDAIVAEVEGSAWITGEHTFVAAPDDPFAEGFSLRVADLASAVQLSRNARARRSSSCGRVSPSSANAFFSGDQASL